MRSPIADGSTLEALRKKLKVNLDSTKGLGGRMMMIVEAFNHQPITDAVTYLVQHHKMLGLIKQERKRHRENAALEREIWESTA